MAYNLLKGKKGLIFGALNEQSIAWKVAQRAVEEGAEIVLTNTPVSIRMGTINELATLLCASPKKQNFISDNGFEQCSRIVNISANACVGWNSVVKPFHTGTPENSANN